MIEWTEAESKEKHGLRDPKLELTICISSPYVHSRVDSDTFTIYHTQLTLPRVYQPRGSTSGRIRKFSPWLDPDPIFLALKIVQMKKFNLNYKIRRWNVLKVLAQLFTVYFLEVTCNFFNIGTLFGGAESGRLGKLVSGPEIFNSGSTALEPTSL